jgi:hypothetical protein
VIGVLTQGFILAKEALYHFSHTSSQLDMFKGYSSSLLLLFYMLSSIWGWSDVFDSDFD